MTFSLDAVTLGVPEVQAAQQFYQSTFSPTADGDGQPVSLDMQGTGHVALQETTALAADAASDPATSGFRGYAMNVVVDQPTEVETLLNAAVQNGAKVLKRAKKGLFGGFSGVCQAPDGTVWKLAAPTKKDTGPAANPPKLTETIAILGVAAPSKSKVFFEALGMTVDRDYGKLFIDFTLSAGVCRLGLMERDALAKDMGVDKGGSGFQAAVFNHRAESREEVDRILAAAAQAGGKVTIAASETQSGYAGHFTDLDGFLWKVTAA
ncbi:bleomycin resistance protein [Kibdelosporangium aridum]|uniref:Bleomycin resistance protein n=1 Tax=Kibdelosporangium aridum TaxID=2030 RepID=A0A428Z4R0_KIBAR|nr:VOC family protein [Kibdelosporangium aridum]RSM81624.1 bleomycin resistance protein [Kibdelosporangium aridum]